VHDCVSQLSRIGLSPGHYSGIPDVNSHHDHFTTRQKAAYIEDQASLEELGIKHYNKLFHFEDPHSVASKILHKHHVHASTSGFYGSQAHLLSGYRNPEFHKQSFQLPSQQSNDATVASNPASYHRRSQEMTSSSSSSGQRRKYKRRKQRTDNDSTGLEFAIKPNSLPVIAVPTNS
jgi:hypothetical protein